MLSKEFIQLSHKNVHASVLMVSLVVARINEIEADSFTDARSGNSTNISRNAYKDAIVTMLAQNVHSMIYGACTASALVHTRDALCKDM